MVELGIISALVALSVGVLFDRIRAAGQRQRDADRLVFELVFPHDFKHEAVLGVIQAMSGMLAPAGPDLQGVHSIVLEAEASRDGRSYRIAVPPHLELEVRHQLESHLPGIQVTPAEPSTHAWMVATELKKTDNSMAMTILSVEVATRTLLAGLDVRTRDGGVLLQWVFSPAMWRVPLGEEKERLPRGRLAVSGRIAARGPTRAAALHLLFQVWHAVNALRTHHVGLTRRWLPNAWVLDRVRRRAGRRWFYPAHLSVTELAVLSAIPAGVSDVQGLPAQRARQLHPDPAISSTGSRFAVSSAAGESPRPLAVSPTGRMQHTMLLGPTGSGKTNALAGLALGDIGSGAGVAVMGPPDLCQDVLDRIPPERADDVIMFEPARGDHAIGVNVFAGAESAVAADHVYSIFAELYKSSWGPRMAQHLRLALQTLAGRPGATLCDIQRLLTDGLYRQDCLRSLTSPQLLADWSAFDAMSPRARSGEIAPVLNKVQPLLASDRLRAVFGQRSGTLDVADILRSRRILLVALPPGELGGEASRLIGSVFVSLFWRAILARSADSDRPDFYYHIDEAPSYLNLPVSLSEMLAQGRAYRAGFTLALQNLSQFAPAQRSATLANARNKMVFRLGHDDARAIGKEFGLQDVEELQRLRRYEVMVQLVTDEGLSRPTTGLTIPLGDKTGLAAAIRARSDQTYGRLRRDVVQQLDQEYRGGLVGAQPGRWSRMPVGVEP